ncbi:MAG: glutamate--cysteine ligase [Actinobacteria bacterium]|nr:glutamate--cysteine ligase [Actinomycetota bacterium]
MFTVGVEEEYHLVDAETLALRSDEPVVEAAKARLACEGPGGGSASGGVAAEISSSQVEVATRVCTTLEEVRTELVRLRRLANSAAAEHGCRILAMATHPFSTWREQRLTDNPRYVGLFERWGLLALQQLITGCHVHVAVEDADLAIAVLDRLRPWLPPLLALSASSPFWEGSDTGYASYRTVWWDRWPITGPPEPLGSRAAFDELVRTMVACGAVDDSSHLYWDVRPSHRFPTLEFRIADVCPSVDDAVLQAALARSLTRTFAKQVQQGRPVVPDRIELVRLARWRAARYGLSKNLVDPLEWELRPAAEVVASLLALLRPDLEEHREWEEVEALTSRILRGGGAAARYRAVMARTGDLVAVTAAAVAETAGESSAPAAPAGSAQGGRG